MPTETATSAAEPSPAELRELVKQQVKKQRSQAAEIVRLWRYLWQIHRRELYRGYGYDDFYAYILAEVGMKTRPYVKDGLAVGRMSALRFEGSVVPVEVLMQVAKTGVKTQEALAVATREYTDFKAAELLEALQAQTDALAGIDRINDSGVRILHSARALRKVAVGR